MSLGLSINKLEAACTAGSDAVFSRDLDPGTEVKRDAPKP